MNKRKFLLTIFIICLFVFPTIVSASYYCKVKDGTTGVRIRSDYNSTNALGYVNGGRTFDLYQGSAVATTDVCPSGWYKINYDGTAAYICGDYINVYEKNDTVVIDNTAATSACEAELKAKGFPASYWPGLCSLKVKYPAWNFEPVYTGLNFSDAVDSEALCKKNTIINTVDDSMKDLSCSGGYDSGYVSASKKAVAYYLNPLNFFTESQIFMFESNYINPNVSLDDYRAITPSILGSFMTSNLPTLTSAMYTAGTSKNVSPIILSARIKQELGKGQATSGKYSGGLLSCISGNYTSRWGIYAADGGNMDYYYNFFNVGVYDGSNGDAAYRAVHYAYRNGWGGTGNQETDLGRAIGGGADFLNSHYINRGQNTIYFHKFNTHPTNTSNIYQNQYMTNIQAPSSEANIVYTAYKNAGRLSSALVFYIPVYNNLNAEISNSGDGATGENTSENQNQGMAVTTMVVSTGYKLNGTEITGINPGTSMDEIKNKINALGGTVTSNNNGTAGTGTKIRVSNGTTQTEFTLIVKGDTSGDGVINALDLLQIQKNILGLYNLDSPNKKAADPSGDGTVNALDLLQVQKHILGSYTISQ